MALQDPVLRELLWRPYVLVDLEFPVALVRLNCLIFLDSLLVLQALGSLGGLSVLAVQNLHLHLSVQADPGYLK